MSANARAGSPGTPPCSKPARRCSRRPQGSGGQDGSIYTRLHPFQPRPRCTDAGVVREFAALVARADGIEAFGEQTLFNLTSPSVTHLLLTKPGAIVAYGQNDRHSAELAVHPQYRRNGIGGALLDAVKARDAGAAIWAHGDLPGARALARSRSLNPTRELEIGRAHV